MPTELQTTENVMKLHRPTRYEYCECVVDRFKSAAAAAAVFMHVGVGDAHKSSLIDVLGLRTATGQLKAA